MYSYHLVHIQEVSFEYKDSSATPSFKALILLFAAISHSPFSMPFIGPKSYTSQQAGKYKKQQSKNTLGQKGEEENRRVLFKAIRVPPLCIVSKVECAWERDGGRKGGGRREKRGSMEHLGCMHYQCK